jgi:hypothetical protein
MCEAESRFTGGTKISKECVFLQTKCYCLKKANARVPVLQLGPTVVVVGLTSMEYKFTLGISFNRKSIALPVVGSTDQTSCSDPKISILLGPHVPFAKNPPKLAFQLAAKHAAVSKPEPV